MSSDNPYSSSHAEVEQKPGPIEGLELGRAYQFVTDSANWVTNIVMGCLCLLSTSIIPIVGQLVFDGYRFEIIEHLHRNRGKDETYPDFDLNRIIDYLVRGLWPFLVTLILSIVVGLPLMILPIIGIFIAMGLGAASGSGDAAAIGMVVMMGGTFIVTLLLGVVVWIVMIPFYLRAGLAQDFSLAFDFAWAKDFIGKMWWDIIVMTIYLMATGLAAGIVGFLFCFVGIYPAATWVSLAQAHLLHQLYEIYLSRGGEPIPLKEPGTSVI